VVPGSKISEELEESEVSEEDDEKMIKVDAPIKVKTKIVGEDEWAEYDNKKIDNGTVATAHSRSASGATASFLPLNHRQRQSGDPNYGWGDTSSSEIELATIVPPTPNLKPPASRKR
jgi:hypothetical protein